MSRQDDLTIQSAMLGTVPCRESARCNGCVIDAHRAEHRRTDLFRRYERERREGNLTMAVVSGPWLKRDAIVAFSAKGLGLVGGTAFQRRHNADRWSHLWFMARTGRILMGWDD